MDFDFRNCISVGKVCDIHCKNKKQKNKQKKKKTWMKTLQWGGKWGNRGVWCCDRVSVLLNWMCRVRSHHVWGCHRQLSLCLLYSWHRGTHSYSSPRWGLWTHGWV